MASSAPKVASRGRWQPKPKVAAPPPPLLTDLKDEQAPLRAGRLRPYLLGAAAVLPVAVGFWIWSSFQSTPASDPSPGVLPASSTGPAVTNQAVVTLSDDGAVFMVSSESGAGNVAPVGRRVQWVANGQPLAGEDSPTLRRSMVKRGDQLVAEIVPNDGTREGARYRTSPIDVGNAVPRLLQVAFDPAEPRTGETIAVFTQVSDLDGDPTRIVYRWWHNGLLTQQGASAQYSGSAVTRGDHLAVEVVASDEHAEGESRKIEAHVGNGAPHFADPPSFTTADGRIRAVVGAVDPDRDPLTFTLLAGPSGMTIDKVSGQIDWKPPTGTQGPQRLRVEIRDDHDGVAEQEFDVTVPPGFAP